MKSIKPFIILLIAIIVMLFPLFMYGEVARFLIDRGKNTFDFVTTFLGATGVFISIALIFFVFYLYIQYIRPHRFIFEGFSNEADLNNLIDAKNIPINLSKLAKEELITQFKILYSQLSVYSQSLLLYDKESSDSTNPNFQDLYLEREEENILWYLPIPTRNGLTYDIMTKLMPRLREIIASLGDKSMQGFVKSIVSVAPKEVAPAIQVLDVALPPHITKAIGYLQWQSHNSNQDAKAGKAGITCEIVEVRKEASSIIHTFWQPEEETKLSPIECYTTLLKPAMRWLALAFWEHTMLSYRSPNKDRERVTAGFLYLLGLLYYASGRQFCGHQDFFFKSAVEHFHEASKCLNNWYLPDLSAANIYSIKMQQQRRSDSAVYNAALNAALDLYDRALKCIGKTEPWKYTKLYVELCKALAQSRSGQEYLAQTARDDVKNQSDHIDLQSINSNVTDCHIYLYSLACWYAGIADMKKSVDEKAHKEARTNARCCLVYSLSRSQLLWSVVRNECTRNHSEIKDICIDYHQEKIPALVQIISLLEVLKPRMGTLPSATCDTFADTLKHILQNTSWSDVIEVIESDSNCHKAVSQSLTASIK